MTNLIIAMDDENLSIRGNIGPLEAAVLISELSREVIAPFLDEDKGQAVAFLCSLGDEARKMMRSIGEEDFYFEMLKIYKEEED